MKTSVQAVDESAHRRGLQLFESGSFAEAATELTLALNSEETAERWNDWASVQFALNHFDEAERGFRRAIDMDPHDPQAVANLGVLLARTGRVREAIPLLEQNRAAMTAEQQVAVTQLLESCQIAAQLESPAGNWQAQIEFGLLRLRQSGNIAEARQLFERACTLNPHAGVAWFFLGLASFYLGSFETARQELQKAELLGHKTALGAQTRGDTFYNQGRFEEARSAYQTALRREPQNSQVRARLGLALVRSGRPEKGLRRLLADLAYTPQAPELHEGLILSYVAIGRIRDAAEAAEKKLRMIANLLPGDYLQAASLWAQLEEWRRAANLLEEGLKMHAGDGELQRSLDEARSSLRATTLEAY